MGMAAVRRRYGVPAKRGMRVRVYDGRVGRITSTYGDNIYVRIDNDRHTRLFHPTWRITYFAPDGSILQKHVDGERVR